MCPIKDTFSVCVWKWQVALAAAGSDQNSVVWNVFVAFETNPLVFRLKLDYSRA